MRRNHVRRADVDDLVYESFHAAYEAMERKSGPLDNPRAFLFKVASNKMLSYWRSHYRNRARLERVQQFEQANVRLNPPDPTAQIDDCDELACQPGLDALAARQREAFLLRHYHDFELAEIADVMGLSVNSVRTHLKRARQKLADLAGREEAS